MTDRYTILWHVGPHGCGGIAFYYEGELINDTPPLASQAMLPYGGHVETGSEIRCASCQDEVFPRAEGCYSIVDWPVGMA